MELVVILFKIFSENTEHIDKSKVKPWKQAPPGRN
jgi:hypothetical protein